jgi:hypothetical protein
MNLARGACKELSAVYVRASEHEAQVMEPTVVADYDCSTDGSMVDGSRNGVSLSASLGE